MKNLAIFKRINLIITAFLLLLTLVFAGATSAVISYAAETKPYTPKPSEEDAEQYGLTDLEYNYFGGFTSLAIGYRSYDGSIEDPDRVYPLGETTLYDYVMGKVSVYGGSITSPEYYGTYDVAYKRFTKVFVHPVFLDTYHGVLGPFTYKECLDNGWLREDQYAFLYQFETILDFSELITNGFCHTDVTLNWQDLSITPLTRESSASMIYENGYVYLRTLMDVELGYAPKLFISFENSEEVIDHTDHTHAEPTYVYKNIDWDNDGETEGDGDDTTPDDGETEGDGDTNPDDGDTNPDEGDTNPDDGETEGGEGGGDIQPDDTEKVPFNSAWCELGYNVYANRVQGAGLEPCSYDYWTGRANIVVNTYARAYADYYGVDYGKYYNDADGMKDGWALVLLYQMYRAEYVSYDYQASNGDRPYIKPFKGLSYEEWLAQFDSQEAYDLYANYCTENKLNAQTLEAYKEGSTITYSRLLSATGEAVTEEQTGTGTVNKPTKSDEGELGILIGKFSIDKLLDNVLSGKLFDGTFIEALLSGNVAEGEPSGGTDWGRILSLILFILIVAFIVWGVIKIYRFFKSKK